MSSTAVHFEEEKDGPASSPSGHLGIAIFHPVCHNSHSYYSLILEF